MSKYSLIYNNKASELDESNCSDFINDEVRPVAGIDKSDILELLSRHEEVNFDIEYYDQPCQNCRQVKNEKDKYFKFLEYHFFIFTKNGRYVISSISKEYENGSYSKLLKQGIIDDSYIVSVIVCIACGDYSIEIEQCDV